MQIPFQITFKNIDPSPAVELAARERAAKLERFFDRITSCHVVVEAQHRHRQQSKLYDILIELVVPGDVLVVNQTGSHDQSHDDIYVALRDAFDTAARRLEDFAGRVRGEARTREPSVQGG